MWSTKYTIICIYINLLYKIQIENEFQIFDFNTVSYYFFKYLLIYNFSRVQAVDLYMRYISVANRIVEIISTLFDSDDFINSFLKYNGKLRKIFIKLQKKFFSKYPSLGYLYYFYI